LDSNPPLVLMSEMPRTDRWYFEVRTLNEEHKVKGEWIVTNGSKIIDSRQYWLSRTAFEADNQEIAQQIADQVVSVIKQCSQRRAQQALEADSP